MAVKVTAFSLLVLNNGAGSRLNVSDDDEFQLAVIGLFCGAV